MSLSVVKTSADDHKEEMLRLVENARKDIESGYITELILVASVTDEDGPPAYVGRAEFTDRWRMLGALEYAKNIIHKA